MEKFAALKILQLHEDRLRQLRQDVVNSRPIDISNRSLRPTLYDSWQRFNQHAHILEGGNIGIPSHKILESQLSLISPTVRDQLVNMLNQRPTQQSKQFILRILEDCHQQKSHLHFDVLQRMVSMIDDREITRQTVPTRKETTELFPALYSYMLMLLKVHKSGIKPKQSRQYLDGELKKVASFLKQVGFTADDVGKLEVKDQTILPKIIEGKELATQLPKSQGSVAKRIFNLIIFDLSGKVSVRKASYKNISVDIQKSKIEIQRQLDLVRDKKQKKQDEKQKLRDQKRAEKAAERKRKVAEKLAEKTKLREEKKNALEIQKQNRLKEKQSKLNQMKIDRAEKNLREREAKCRRVTQQHPNGFESCNHRDSVLKTMKEKRIKQKMEKDQRLHARAEQRKKKEKQKDEKQKEKEESQKARYITQIMKRIFDLTVKGSLESDDNFTDQEKHKLTSLKKTRVDDLKVELNKLKQAAKIQKDEQKSANVKKIQISSEQLRETALTTLKQSMELVKSTPSDNLLQKFNSCMVKCSAFVSPNGSSENSKKTDKSTNQIRAQMQTKYNNMNETSLKKEAKRLHTKYDNIDIVQQAAEEFNINYENVIKFALRDNTKRSRLLQMMVDAATHSHLFKHDNDYHAKYENELTKRNQINKEKRLKTSSFHEQMQFVINSEKMSSEELIVKAKEYENDENVAPEFLTALKESVVNLSQMKNTVNLNKAKEDFEAERDKLMTDIDSWGQQFDQLNKKENPTAEETNTLNGLVGKLDFSKNKLVDVQKKVKDPESYYRELVIANIGSIMDGSNEDLIDNLETDVCHSVENWCQENEFENDQKCYDHLFSAQYKTIDNINEDQIKQCIGPPYNDDGMTEPLTMESDEDQDVTMESDEDQDDDLELQLDEDEDEDEDVDDDLNLQSDDETEDEEGVDIESNDDDEGDVNQLQQRIKETHEQVLDVQNKFDGVTVAPGSTQIDMSYADVLFGSATSSATEQNQAEHMAANAIVTLAKDLKEAAVGDHFGTTALKELLIKLDINDHSTIGNILDHLYPEKESATAFTKESKDLIKLLAELIQHQPNPNVTQPTQPNTVEKSLLQNNDIMKTIVGGFGQTIEHAKREIIKAREKILAQSQDLTIQTQVKQMYMNDGINLLGDDLIAKVLKVLLTSTYEESISLVFLTLVDLGSSESGKQQWAQEILQHAVADIHPKLDLLDPEKLLVQVDEMEQTESGQDSLYNLVDDMLENMNSEQLLQLFSNVQVQADILQSEESQQQESTPSLAKVPLSPPRYFQQYNFDDHGRVLDECSMHALNSTLVNCLDRPPVEKWSTSGIPQQVVTGHRKLKSGRIKETKHNLWFPSDGQLANQNQVSANWAYLFNHLDPGGKNVTLRGVDFHKWALNGVADTNFKYAVAQLPTVANIAHVVSIVRAKDSSNLVLVDSNLRGTRMLRDVALQNEDRWFMFPGAYIVIRENL